MKHLHLMNALKLGLAAAAMSAASAGAAPILSHEMAVPQASAGASSAFIGTDGPMFTAMGMNGGHSVSVAFLGDDNSIVIGRSLRGPWSKNALLRSGQDGAGGGKDFLPSVETVTGLPEPSSLALLALGLLTLGFVRRRQARR